MLVTISDKKIGHDAGNGTIDYYTADVVTATDYAPFGMALSSRKYTASSSNYRYGFNGKENDNEVKGEGNQQDYGARVLDTRLGRFLSVDPLAKQFAYYSPYQSTGNSPIRFIDLDGQEPTSPPEFLKNIKLTHDLDKGNTIDGYFDPNDRLHYMSVEKLYDETKKQAFFVHKDNQGTASYWVSQESTLRIHRKADGTTEANGHWERYETYEQTQQKIRAAAPDIILGFLGGGVVAAVAAPVIAPYAISYGTQVATASIGSRFIAAGADASVQYAGNLMEHGWGKQNLNNINWSSSGLAFINPASIVTTGIGGNFLKYTHENGSAEAVGGAKFNLTTATSSSIVDIAGGKLGDFIQGKAAVAGFKNLSGLTLGEVTSNAVAAPVNVIVQAATEKSNNR